MAAEAAGARKVVKLPITGAFHSPLVGERGGHAAPRGRGGRLAGADDAVHVHRDRAVEPAERLGGILLDQLTAPVKFTQAVKALVGDGVDTFVEIGPGKVLERPDQAL